MEYTGETTPSQINSLGNIQVEPPLSDQLPVEHTGQGDSQMHLFHQSTGTDFTDPRRDGRLSQIDGSGARTQESVVNKESESSQAGKDKERNRHQKWK